MNLTNRLALAFLLSFHASSANAVTGNNMLEICGYDEPTEPCIFYFIGVSSGARTAFGIAFNEGTSSKYRFCPPNTVTNRQMADIAIDHLRDSPKVRHLPADLLAILSWTEVFPCQ